MPATDLLVAPRFRMTELLERGRDNAVVCPVYRDGALVEPSAAAVVVKKPDGTTLAAPSATVTSSVATATVPAASLSGAPYGFGYWVEWTLTIEGVPRTFDNRAAVVRRALAPVISDGDLTSLYPSLATTQLPAGVTSFQGWIDEAWFMIQNRLLGNANRPNLILEPYALREVHRYLACHLIFNGGTTGRGEIQQRLAKECKDNYEHEWGQLSFSYGSGDDGVADSSTRRRPAASQTFLAEPEGPGTYPYPYGWR